MKESTDKETLTDLCWALSYIGDGEGKRIQLYLENNILPRLVELLGHPSLQIAIPALRTLGNVITGDDSQTQYAIDAGIIPALCSLMDSKQDSAKKEAAWAISNITAGSQTQIQLIIDQGVMAKIINLALNDSFDVKRECIWAISNALSGASEVQTQIIASLHATEALCNVLQVNDARTLAIALEGLENLLKKSKAYLNDIVNLIETCGGLSYMEKLQSHQNTHIYTKVVAIIETYFGVEEEESTPGNVESVSIFNF
jgi:hypothetical protein